MGITDRDMEKVIEGLKYLHDVRRWSPDESEESITARRNITGDALALLKVQEQATIEPKRIDLADETKAWLDKMDAVDALGNIANICMDWDGYRTANGLGGLINEILAYARYCADRLLKAQEPRVMSEEEVAAWNHTKRSIREPVYVEHRDSGEVFAHSVGFGGTCDYGVTWRCWTSRPDEKRRAETPWE